jgi:hypothetical protein
VSFPKANNIEGFIPSLVVLLCEVLETLGDGAYPEEVELTGGGSLGGIWSLGSSGLSVSWSL